MVDGSWPEQPAEEKGVDVALGIDFVRLAVRGAHDVGVLMSTDTDLVPALEAAKYPSEHFSSRARPASARNSVALTSLHS
jgi:uncharacterized LabA/DUF88 family protein